MQSEVEVEIYVLEHIEDLVAVLEKAPDVGRQNVAVPLHKAIKRGLIARESPLDQGAIQDSLLIWSALLN